MDSKLTLKLNADVIAKAKRYAKENNSSLSRMIEAYLLQLTNNKPTEEIKISPFVKSLQSGVQIPNELSDKDIYRKYLKEKYK